MKHYAFPSIDQFRHAVKHVSDAVHYRNQNDIPTELPVLKFHGTTKIHGSNGAVCVTNENVVYAQSRSNVITIDKDNAGFAQFVEMNKSTFIEIRNNLMLMLMPEKIVFYGEWCGKGIQKNVAVSQLDRMFVIFGIKCVYVNEEEEFTQWISNEKYKPSSHDHMIFNIEDFDTWNVDIDFSQPELVQNHLIDLTNMVEKCCPVGKHFGIESIGEGIVWNVVNKPDWLRSSDLRFKVKGEKHQISKVRTLAAIDVEKITQMKELVSTLATENRMEQGISVLTEQGHDMNDRKNTVLLIKWVKDDVLKEESDTMLASELDVPTVLKNIGTRTGQWFNSRM